MKRRRSLYHYMKVALPLAAGVILLSSCIDVNESITMNTDGSGVVDLTYHIARMVSDLQTQAGANRLLPLPADPASLQQAIQGVAGLNLQSFRPQESSRDVGANLKLQFSSIGTLDQAIGQVAAPGMSYRQSNGITTFTQSLYQGNPSGVSPQTLQLAQQLFSTYRLTFTLKAPQRIRRVSIGTISSDGSTATYSTTVPGIIQSKSPVVWEVTW